MEESKNKKIKFNPVVAVVLGVVAVVAVLIWQLGPMKVQNFEFLEMRVMVAESQAQKVRGLSGLELEDFSAEADAMYFPYSSKKERIFWMKDMNFAIDIAWIADGKVVKVERNVLPPEEAGEIEKMYSRPFEVDGVLEFPAGGADEYGLYPGVVISDLVK